jgi:hypothetical protein
MKDNPQLVKKTGKLQTVKRLRKGIRISGKDDANQVLVSGLEGVTEPMVPNARTA